MMMRLFYCVIFTIGILCAAVGSAQEGLRSGPTTVEERLGYAYGVEVATSLKRREVPIDIDQFIAAFRAVLQDQELKMSRRQMEVTFQEYEKILESKAKGEELANLEAGRTFLGKKAIEQGVTRTDSGLLYEVIKATNGPKPKPGSNVIVKYRGTLLDGTEFDSTEKRAGGTAQLRLDRVIRGWNEGLQLMSIGS